MSELHPRLETLDPMRIAAVHVISANPERDALHRLRAWARTRGFTAGAGHRVFGFNRPAPSPDRPDYGYEFWMEVDRAEPANPAIDLKDFPGGLYAATTCRLVGDPAGRIGEIWQKLWRWAQAGDYRWRRTHELEHLLNPFAAEPDAVLDLYLPVEPRPAPLAASSPNAPHPHENPRG